MLSTCVLLTNIVIIMLLFLVQKEMLGVQLFPGKNLHICAQTREVVCTKIVLPEVTEKGITLYKSIVFCSFLCVCFSSGLNILLKSLM